MKKITVLIFILCLFSRYVSPGQLDRFIFTQVRHEGYWDPYPDIFQEILSFLVSTTSIEVISSRRVVSFSSDELFESPFLVITGSGDIGRLNKEQIDNVGKFIKGGGVIFVDSSEAVMGSTLISSIKREFKRVFPDSVFEDIPRDHAVLRSFYLLRTIGGRRIVSNTLKGLKVDGFTSVIISENDCLGAWARDKLGNHIYSCTPGGEKQRLEAIKLTANIIIYGFTGTYKTDAIHIPFILQKLKTRY
ncbi:MAG: DUF4159 domain-containing protein [bacterium]